MSGSYEGHSTTRRVPPIPSEAKAFIVADTRITSGHNDEMDWDVEEVAKQEAVEVLVPPDAPQATRVRFHPGAELPRSLVEGRSDSSGVWQAFNENVIAVDGNGSSISSGNEDTGNSSINKWQQDKRRRSSGSNKSD